MRKLWIGILLVVMSFSALGCGAGLATDLSTYDNVIRAATEAKLGVVAFNAAVQRDTVHRQSAMLALVGDGIKTIAMKDGAMTETKADKISQEVVTSLQAHIANYMTQERRRSELFAVTIDNLNYIIRISEQGKEFSIYRADIGEQWKAYLQSSALDNIKSVNDVVGE